jgi:glycosyltransferase involved in cell wall biosynthesis
MDYQDESASEVAGESLVAPHPDVPAASHAAQRCVGRGGRVVFFDGVFPCPDRDSGSVDSINYVTWLTSLGYEVHFLSTSCIFDGKSEKPVVSAGAKILMLPNEEAILDFLGREGKAFDLFFLSRVGCGGKFFEASWRSNPGAAIIFNTVDLHHVRDEREAKIRQDRKALFRSGETRERELYIARQSDLTIVVSNWEKEILEAAIPGTPVAVMPLFRKVPKQIEDFERRRGIGFIGGFAHAPNVDAIQYFLDEVWPRIHDLDPALRFEIAGLGLPDLISQSLPAGVSYEGHVADLEGWLGKLRLTVAPLRYGAGAKGKVASSIVNGVPVIGTRVAFEGMGLDQGIASASDTAEAMARDIVSVYSDKAAWETLSRVAHAFGMTNLSLEAGQKRFSDLLAGFMNRDPASARRLPI